MNSPDWSATKKPHGTFLALNAKSRVERNEATFCYHNNLVVAVLKIRNTEMVFKLSHRRHQTKDLSLAVFVRPPAIVHYIIVICVARDWFANPHIS